MDPGFYDYDEGITALDALYDRPRLMAQCPHAVLTVHPRGARHMIDPSRLMAATVEIYGAEATERIYGRVPPVPRERVLETPEGAAISLAGRDQPVAVRPAGLHQADSGDRADRSLGGAPPGLDAPRKDALEVFKLDIELNAQGLEAWLDSNTRGE